ncbi:uncharacterized protein MYCGRDRAFT_95365 [Zymoseptoria tritici IPO323]|uniref:Cellulose-binding Sde182 nucleoside hydrolase-like domain-containing protein n=1 Tax=Zymoseptoria tritici (strain CBS 115943 / IPO323) TaxID=336722 RepID=F9XIR8_ZYMTI|nr:uncharacterized protein MYCGRDRAFT_95365 [Zymoseptoria tritici IPO323]EGP85243.1 hypothetical protein MYCGRDRAFT_95365 [Zymoseptoria tritici IPO323]
MSDISNEPDDTMSFIRLLLHSDQYNVAGLVATTSTWLNSTVVPQEILKTTHAFGLVQANLALHTSGQFPTSSYLSSIPSPTPATPAPLLGLAHFIFHLRISAISDQDSSAPGIRAKLPFDSIHRFPPRFQRLRSRNLNFQLGPLGSQYPDIAYTMEGDSPAILHTMMNGLNGGPYDHPEWGGWGGGYILLDRSGQSNVYSNTYDVVLGKDNRTLTSNHATTWRWRQAFQDEMSARVQWSILPSYASGSHPPVVVINGSCGSQPIIYTLPGGSTITLDVRKTYDPDETLPGEHELQWKVGGDEIIGEGGCL